MVLLSLSFKPHSDTPHIENILFLYTLVTSPKKSLKSPKKGKKLSRKESDKATATTKEVKNEKALYSINPKNISKEDIAKWIKSGDVDKMELAVLAGKGKIVYSA